MPIPRLSKKLPFVILAAALLFLGMTAPISKQPHTDRYVVDTTQAVLYWRADNHHGTVPFRQGELIITDGQITDGNFSLLMDSLKNLDIELDIMRIVLENIIRSKELFHAEKYPYALFHVFNSTINKNGEGTLVGDLTIREITKCIEFPVTIHIQGDSLIAVTDSIRIDRTDWDITSMSPNHVKGEEAFIVSDTLVMKVKFKAMKWT